MVHTAGICHRDVKPSNILLQRNAEGSPTAKLTDFGLGAVQDREVLKSVYASRVDGVAGTWDFMAPELREGGQASPRSDIYALGVTLYQVVTGDPRRSLGDWERDVDNEVLRDLIRKCIATDPEERWTRAGGLARELRRYDELVKELEIKRQRAKERGVCPNCGLRPMGLWRFIRTRGRLGRTVQHCRHCGAALAEKQRGWLTALARICFAVTLSAVFALVAGLFVVDVFPQAYYFIPRGYRLDAGLVLAALGCMGGLVLLWRRSRYVLTVSGGKRQGTAAKYLGWGGIGLGLIAFLGLYLFIWIAYHWFDEDIAYDLESMETAQFALPDDEENGFYYAFAFTFDVENPAAFGRQAYAAVAGDSDHSIIFSSSDVPGIERVEFADGDVIDDLMYNSYSAEVVAENADQIRSMWRGNAEYAARLEDFVAYNRFVEPSNNVTIPMLEIRRIWKLYLLMRSVDIRETSRLIGDSETRDTHGDVIEAEIVADISRHVVFLRNSICEVRTLSGKIMFCTMIMEAYNCISRMMASYEFDENTVKNVESCLYPPSEQELDLGIALRNDFVRATYSALMRFDTDVDMNNYPDLLDDMMGTHDEWYSPIMSFLFKKNSFFNDYYTRWLNVEAIMYIPESQWDRYDMVARDLQNVYTAPGIRWLDNPAGRVGLSVAIPKYNDLRARYCEIVYVQNLMLQVQCLLERDKIQVQDVQQFLDSLAVRFFDPYTESP